MNRGGGGGDGGEGALLRLQVKVLLRSKNTFIFSSDFKSLFTKHSPCEILRVYFEKKTVYLNYNFPI